MMITDDFLLLKSSGTALNKDKFLQGQETWNPNNQTVRVAQPEAQSWMKMSNYNGTTNVVIMSGWPYTWKRLTVCVTFTLLECSGNSLRQPFTSYDAKL